MGFPVLINAAGMNSELSRISHYTTSHPYHYTHREDVLVWEFQSGHPLLWAKQHT